jgi:hypothetical protein
VPLTASAVLPINVPVGTATAAQAAGPSEADTPLLAAAVALDAVRPIYVSPQVLPALPLDGQVAESPPSNTGEDAPQRPAWSLPLQMQTEALAQVAAGSAVHLTSARVQGSELSASADARLASALAATAAFVPVAASAVVPDTAPALTPLVGPAIAVPAPMGGAAPAAVALAISGADSAPHIVGAGVVLGGTPTPAALAAPGTPGLATPPAGGVSDVRWQLSEQGNSLQAAGADSVELQTDLSDQVQMEALRLRLAPQEAITRRLAAMSGSGEQSAWASVSGQAAATAVLRLDLRESGVTAAAAFNLASDVVDVPEAEGQPSPSTPQVSAEPGRAGHAGAASTPAAWSSTAAQRAEIYEQLAQRLGEALGQRLQNQLERGQWKMQMRLDPLHLGRIDLELDMSAGALDAVFRSDNQLTRDLIAQGLPRLRESLNQSGTAVANVWVQGDSSRQSGGNPTPWRASEPSVQSAGHETESQEPVVQATGNRARQGTSAWDVLA